MQNRSAILLSISNKKSDIFAAGSEHPHEGVRQSSGPGATRRYLTSTVTLSILVVDLHRQRDWLLEFAFRSCQQYGDKLDKE